MSIKKTAIITVFMSAIFVSANLMIAKAYEPLVRLPGLPAEGEITLSQYIVGLYNFLLSIVGIVAVMMLIIGGMKYIAAAGNASIIADAKDTISNAIFGLLLALLSWVIVSTINPDVLYIKHPASSLTDAYESNLGACGTYNIDTDICTCQDSVTFIPPDATDQPTCEVACADNCGTTEALPCIYGGSSEKPIYDELGGGCRCVDGADVVSSAPDGTGCNEICQTPGFVTDGEYHCLVVDVKIGNLPPGWYDLDIPLIDNIRMHALYDSNPTSPVEIIADTQIAFNIRTTTAGPPVSFQVDSNIDGICLSPPDIAPFPNDTFMVFYTYAGISGGELPLCKPSDNSSFTCPFKICATDAFGSASTIAYFKMLAP